MKINCFHGLSDKLWLRKQDSDLRPSGYGPDELPDCSIPRYVAVVYYTTLYTY